MASLLLPCLVKASGLWNTLHQQSTKACLGYLWPNWWWTGRNLCMFFSVTSTDDTSIQLVYFCSIVSIWSQYVITHGFHWPMLYITVCIVCGQGFCCSRDSGIDVCSGTRPPRGYTAEHSGDVRLFLHVRWHSVQLLRWRHVYCIGLDEEGQNSLRCIMNWYCWTVTPMFNTV